MVIYSFSKHLSTHSQNIVFKTDESQNYIFNMNLAQNVSIMYLIIKKKEFCCVYQGLTASATMKSCLQVIVLSSEWWLPTHEKNSRGCMCIVYVCVKLCMCASMYAFMYVYKCVFVCICCVFVCLCIYMYIHLCVCLCVYKHICNVLFSLHSRYRKQLSNCSGWFCCHNIFLWFFLTSICFQVPF